MHCNRVQTDDIKGIIIIAHVIKVISLISLLIPIIAGWLPCANGYNRGSYNYWALFVAAGEVVVAIINK